MSKSARIFAILGIVFLVAAIFLLYRWITGPVEIQATRIEKSGPNEYEIQTKAGKWVDTGVWILTERMVIATGPDIFTLAVDNTTTKSTLRQGSSSTYYSQI